jgi:hypothetical protein
LPLLHGGLGCHGSFVLATVSLGGR